MRRTDRLFDLIQILRDGRLHRAGDIAALMQVSVRTVWRDMATLMASGLPVEGERGVGYILRAPVTLPPMILTAAELEALRLGIRLVAEGADAGLARAAREVATKIASVTPAPQAAEAEEDALFAFPGPKTRRAEAHVPLLRRAIKGRQRLTLSYIDPEGRESHRDVRPLVLDLKSSVWTLGAWCERRAGFRTFRLDRIIALTETAEVFAAEKGKSLRDYKALLKSDPQETQNSGPAGS